LGGEGGIMIKVYFLTHRHRLLPCDNFFIAVVITRFCLSC